MHGADDGYLIVFPIDFDDATPPMFSATASDTESVLVSPFSAVPIDAADAWIVGVFDAPGGGGSSYSIVVTETPPADDLVIGARR